MSQKEKNFDFAIGGQAVIEGVMMRSPNFTVVSVRSPDGTIIKSEEAYKTIGQRIKILSLPFIRGIINIFEMLIIGTKALNFSSKAFMAETEEISIANPKTKPIDSKIKPTNKIETISLILSVIFALGLSLFLFKFIPLWITTWLSGESQTINNNYLIFNLIDGIIKISLFVLYIGLIAILPDMRRVFAYHGAEHKSIMTYEHGLDLTVENAKNQTRFHPRCGTSFILIVFLISIFIFTLIPRYPDFLINFFIRLTALPLIASLSYEFLKFTSSKNNNSIVFKVLAWPGLLLQKLTTREPNDEMLEVALESLKTSLKLENEIRPI